jgi:hypothetical protein
MKILPLLYCLLAVHFLNAQKGIVASGGDATNSSGSISYSLGQVDYAAASNSTCAIYPGIQQPYEVFVSSVDASFVNINLDLFPNPSFDFLNIRLVEFREKLHFQLMDLNGRIISESKILELQSQINMQDLPSATYLLSIYENGKAVKTFKIVKK